MNLIVLYTVRVGKKVSLLMLEFWMSREIGTWPNIYISEKIDLGTGKSESYRIHMQTAFTPWTHSHRGRIHFVEKRVYFCSLKF